MVRVVLFCCPSLAIINVKFIPVNKISPLSSSIDFVFESEAVTIKRKITTKYRLPVLNWAPMPPHQVKGTIFSDLDDEKLYSVSLMY